jgi:uncharacterized protein Yka (UPF0111/DUF47 family)
MPEFNGNQIITAIAFSALGFLLVRFVKGMDANTEAVNKLTATVERIGEKILSHEKRIDGIEHEVDKIRSRIHSINNTLQKMMMPNEKRLEDR